MPSIASFARVQEILNGAITAWQNRTGHAPVLAKHDIGFGWATRDQLVASTAFGLPLISPDVIKNRLGAQSNLVVALRTGVAPYPRMPRGGPYLSDPEIDEIVQWINNGALP